MNAGAEISGDFEPCFADSREVITPSHVAKAEQAVLEPRSLCRSLGLMTTSRVMRQHPIRQNDQLDRATLWPRHMMSHALAGRQKLTNWSRRRQA